MSNNSKIVHYSYSYAGRLIESRIGLWFIEWHRFSMTLDDP